MDSAYIRKQFRLLAAAALVACLAGSCVEDPTFGPMDEGREATVQLHWAPAEMKIQSRALSDEQERSVHSLWIGIYDYKSGALKRITVASTTHDQGYYITPDATLQHHVLDPDQALQLHTTSGESRIVAVANPDTNYGVSSLLESGATTTLLELLRQCDTWQKFCSVAALTGAVSSEGNTTPNITLTDSNMPMAGVYYPTLDHDTGTSDPVDWTADETNHVYIPAGASALPGTIHLRRLHAHVNFQIIPGRHITVEPISWQVHNIPYVSYLQEREQTAAEGSNAGDADELGRKLGGNDYRGNYASSRLTTAFDKADNLGAAKDRSGFRFDFYQFENKHTGLDHVTTYNDREREHKAADGTNTGVYSSLVDAATGGKNNMASFVEFQAKVSYYLAADGTTIVDPSSPDIADATPRLGFATYVVHLGYCEGEGAPKARDFNCRRNTRYTYYITINGVDQIRVEAEKEGDTPGAEGDVIDYEPNSFYDLDCHYAVFNISMTNVERDKLYWRLRAPYGTGGAHILDYTYDETGTNRQDPFYSWIRFRPTSGKNVLAEYSATDSEMWTLQDLKDVANHPGNNRSTDINNTQEQYYTVFVDEYAYLIDRNGQRLAATEWKDSAWENYVNQPDRTVWMIVDEDNYHLSYDEESLYAKTKYMISQRSIQTYYSTTILNDSKTALGVEHMNETFGKNLTWTWQTSATGALSHSNGRWNSWKYLTQSTLTQSTWGGNRWITGTRLRWNQVVNSTTPDATYPVAALISTTEGGTRSTGSEGSSDPDPGGAYYEILAACMSRNRDLNGNGRIDENELKWYLPAEGKYERIMLGRNALSSWLFNPTQEPWYTTGDDPYAQKALKNKTRMTAIQDKKYMYGVPNWVHYVASDYRKFFTDEGGSWSDTPFEHWSGDTDIWGSKTGRWAWNIRCVRNLGVSFDTVTTNADDDPVARAYSYDSNTRIFDASSYNDNCLRAAIQTHLPVHPVSDFTRNLIARKFEVATADAVAENVPIGQIDEYLNTNRPCRDYTQNGDNNRWRIPNQREIMMILSQGLLPNNNERMSCTKEAYAGGIRYAMTTNVLTMKAITGDTHTIRVRCVRDVE